MAEKSLTSPLELDAERIIRLADLAEERHTTVIDLVEGAVDAAFPTSDADRRRAAGRFLLDAPAMAVPADWTNLRPDVLDGPP